MKILDHECKLANIYISTGLGKIFLSYPYGSRTLINNGSKYYSLVNGNGIYEVTFWVCKEKWNKITFIFLFPPASEGLVAELPLIICFLFHACISLTYFVRSSLVEKNSAEEFLSRLSTTCYAVHISESKDNLTTCTVLYINNKSFISV